ncbi:dTDP-4-dehydrorhamnose reductase [Lujinxingia vulgaris]|uniref:dTDP-4-dehydrorhamnose reductase n=2 Tax=Lujinxingia vulgaris TaxID=2600176 RepID=A0A5C6X489_9DELT|nr:dTDP-4-dehydrorhamnose reductase [Lujinxingia vulgaris]
MLFESARGEVTIILRRGEIMVSTIVIASAGQLGSELMAALKARGEAAVGVNLESCNLDDPQSIEATLARYPGVTRIFNAGAFTQVDRAEQEPQAAFRTNALGVGFLAHACAERQITLVHFSTDYVFGEGHSRPILEDAAPNPLSVYGRSKLLGERLALQHNPRTFVLRSCGLYGPSHPNFVRAMLRVGQGSEPVAIVNDQIVTPTPARTLAEVAIALSTRDDFGIFHATAQGQCSWFDFARALFDHLDLRPRLRPVDSQSWGAAARRPTYSVLENRALKHLQLDSFGDWYAELAAFLNDHGQRLLDELRPAPDLGAGHRPAAP